MLMAGVYTDVFSSRLLPDAPPDAPPTTLMAYRLSQSGGELLWRVQVQTERGVYTLVAHDARTIYLAAAPPGVIFAFRLADGMVLWHQQALASTGIVVDSGYLFETASGVDNPCRTPAVHQAPQIRALTTADGGIAWTQILAATGPVLRRADATR